MIAERTYRIGEVAELVGTTPRTIRYYEEIGLLPAPPGFEKGRHRTFGEAEVARLRELIRLRDLLGISLEELKGLVEAEEARAIIRERFQTTDDPGEQKQLLDEAQGLIERQLELVRLRREALDGLEAELTDRRKRIRKRLKELGS
jgi:MerR family transcriptional regulator, repressor of the yfmOP operon